MYLYGPHQGGEKTAQEPIGTWEAKKPFTGDTVLRLDHNPGAHWTVKQDPGVLEPGAAYAAFGGSTTEDQAISQVGFTMGSLTRIPADHLSYYHAKTVSVSAFHDTVCQ